MKLSDPTQGLSDSPLEGLSLEDQTLGGHRKFWERSASIDAVHAIADQDDAASFEVSGRVDASDLATLIPPGRTARVLEIGCGTGRIMQHLAPRCAEVHGVDIAEEMARKGEERLAHLANVKFHVGNGYDLADFDDDTFDLVYSAFAFQHMPKTIAYNYFVEAWRVLRPKGLLRFQVPNILRDDHFAAFHHFTQPWFVDHPYPMHFWTPAEVVSLLARAGYWVEHLDDEVVVRARKTGIAGAPPTVLARAAALEGMDLGQRVTQLERDLARIRSNPVIRVGRLLRRVVR